MPAVSAASIPINNAADRLPRHPHRELSLNRSASSEKKSHPVSMRAELFGGSHFLTRSLSSARRRQAFRGMDGRELGAWRWCETPAEACARRAPHHEVGVNW